MYPGVPPLPPKPDALPQEEWEAIVVAQRLRHELGLADDAPVPCVLELAEERLALEVVVMPLRDELSGFFFPAKPRGLVFVQAGHAVSRQRFTVAHEIGHFALGHAAAPRLHETPAGAATSSGEAASAEPPRVIDLSHHYRPQRETDPQERAANAFAAELLTPAAGARQVCEPWAKQPPLDQTVRLSAHFGVSAYSAAVRLSKIKRFDWRTMQRVREQLKAGEHLPRYEALDLPSLDDELQRHAAAGTDAGPRFSANARRTIAALRRDADAGWASAGA